MCTVCSDEIPDARLARLQQMREHAQTTCSKEAPEARAAGLQQKREHAQSLSTAHSAGNLLSIRWTSYIQFTLVLQCMIVLFLIVPIRHS